MKGTKIDRHLSTEEKTAVFIAKARAVHGEKYEYLSEYLTNRIPLQIRCKTCDYLFRQTPNNHLNGKGCRLCGRKRTTKRNTRNHDEFIAASRAIYGDCYDCLDEYVNNSTKLRFLSRTCGHKFLQTPTCHLRGNGCPECNINVRTTQRRKSPARFLAEARSIHGSRYEYLSSYLNDGTHVRILCKTCGHVFLQTPSQHLQGTGCGRCARFSVPCTVAASMKDNFYVFDVRDKETGDCFLKFGRSVNVQKRYRGMQTRFCWRLVHTATDQHSRIAALESKIKRLALTGDPRFPLYGNLLHKHYHPTESLRASALLDLCEFVDDHYPLSPDSVVA